MSEEKTDLLDTESYQKHHKFFFTLVVNLLLSLTFVEVLVRLEPSYLYLKNMIINHQYIDKTLLVFNIVNNLYQVYAHVFTGTKFLGYDQVVPAGSDGDQSLLAFTLSNIFDILGWMSIFVYLGYAPLFLATLAAFHYSSGLIAIFYNETFHEYFIGPPKRKDNNFGYKYWKTFRSCFVLTDAISRGYVTYRVLFH